mgnify:CR=1 FL=1
MLKKSASIVLASFRGSTYRSVRLASSLAAALLDGLFEHPADYSVAITLVSSQYRVAQNKVFEQPATGGLSERPVFPSITSLRWLALAVVAQAPQALLS